MIRAVRFVLVTMFALVVTPRAEAQGQMPGHAGHQMPMASAPLGLPETRDASGTAWQPDEGTIHSLMRHTGPWHLMLHTNAFLQYIETRSDRGDRQFGSVNWLMGMAGRDAGGGQLTLRGMFSAEPLTVGRCGYPDLVATGEFCNGEPIHDRQHPHDVFMELAAQYRRALSEQVAFEVYGGPAGEPALGPAAYPHRRSSMPNPFAPISHHWLDSTHISFGVVTGGLYGRKWKAEASAFNGREPDDERYGVDVGALDSRSARLWILPTDRWAFQVSAARLESAEQAEGGGERQDVTRVTASSTYHQKMGETGFLAATMAWGRNREEAHTTQAVLGEAVIERNVHAFFVRGEVTQKSAEELVLPTGHEQIFTLTKLQVGYTRLLKPRGVFIPAIGGSLALAVLPAGLRDAYGSRGPMEFALFVAIRPR